MKLIHIFRLHVLIKDCMKGILIFVGKIMYAYYRFGKGFCLDLKSKIPSVNATRQKFINNAALSSATSRNNVAV